jgi:hypothetical protein
MPSASAEAEAEMLRLFGSDADSAPWEGWDFRARKFLRDAGYTLLHDFVWQPKPGVTEVTDMTDDEWACCMRYLIEEWDFGGLTTDEPTKET